jgi:hypothetical protein
MTNNHDKPVEPQPPLPSPVDVLVFRAGRWHLRDGDGFARKPYYLDTATGRLIEPDQ